MQAALSSARPSDNEKVMQDYRAYVRSESAKGSVTVLTFGSWVAEQYDQLSSARAERDAIAVHLALPTTCASIDILAAITEARAEIERLKLRTSPECWFEDETCYDSPEQFAEEAELEVGAEFDLQGARYTPERYRVKVKGNCDDIEYDCELVSSKAERFPEYFEVVKRAEKAEADAERMAALLRRISPVVDHAANLYLELTAREGSGADLEAARDLAKIADELGAALSPASTETQEGNNAANNR
jgi:hypothetical protein